LTHHIPVWFGQKVFESNIAQAAQKYVMRGYSATGDLKKALEHAKIALGQAPDDVNKKSLEAFIKTLAEGKAIGQ
jgi:predicted lipoprotein